MVEFTEDEKQVLSRFVTNVDGNVFALRNLPEVIKGALFSRYSRTSKGLRQLLLDEFVKSDEVGVKEILDSVKGAGESEILAIEKAQAFYDRILDGYGDDSVGELGGAHIAIENLSNIATKVIEDMRIGGSPLEKSTRYVWFDKKINGEYQFYRDPVIMNSEFADEYVNVCNMLLDLYSKLIEPMKQYYIERVPRDENTPEQAYKFSIRAKACDTLRPLLPGSVLTNMGIFGNGRFFETMILKLRSHPLQEMREIADQVQMELNKIIPSFVRRCQTGHKHFAPAYNFLNKSTEGARKKTSEILTEEPIHAEEVELVEYDKNADEKILAALLYPHSKQPMRQILEKVRKMDTEERKKIIHEVLSHRENRRHKPPRAFENAYFTFDLLGDYGIYRDMERHRILTQERQDLKTDHGYITPPEIIDAGFENEWKEVMNKAAEVYKQISEKYPKEAQYIVPFAYKIRWYFTMNPRAIYWVTELRSSPQGHPNYRRMAQKMYKLAKQASPLLFEYARFVDMNDYSLGRLDAEKKLAEKKVKEE
ncbi:MAG: FAD-dependent thymidylate synthase [Candidatus Aenigmatarchaeota archaeon]